VQQEWRIKNIVCAAKMANKKYCMCSKNGKPKTVFAAKSANIKRMNMKKGQKYGSR